MSRLTERARRELLEERREQILGAAVEVFSERGYHDAKISLIAEKARLAEGTIYRYFSSKRDLLLAAWEHVAVGSVLPELGRVEGAQGLEQILPIILRQRLQTLQQYAPFVRLVMQQADVDEAFRADLVRRMQPLRVMLGDLVAQGIAHGIFRPVRAPIVIRAMVGMVMGTALLNTYDPEAVLDVYAIDDIADELAGLILRGVLKPESESEHEPDESRRPDGSRQHAGGSDIDQPEVRR